jgi:hypothetical protein
MQQFTAVLVSFRCIVLSMIEGTNDGASKGEHNRETDWVREYRCMGWNVSRQSLILVLLLVGTLLTIRRRSIARVGAGGSAVAP